MKYICTTRTTTTTKITKPYSKFQNRLWILKNNKALFSKFKDRLWILNKLVRVVGKTLVALSPPTLSNTHAPLKESDSHTHTHTHMHARTHTCTHARKASGGWGVGGRVRKLLNNFISLFSHFLKIDVCMRYIYTSNYNFPCVYYITPKKNLNTFIT